MAGKVFLLFISLMMIDVCVGQSCNCTDAQETVLNENLKNISIGEMRNFCVCSQFTWSASGYIVSLNEEYSITVPGTQTWIDYNHVTTADGYLNKWVKMICCDDQWLQMDQYLSSLRYPSGNWAQLICCLGRIDDITGCYPIGTGMDIIVSTIPGIAATTTTLDCYANDFYDFYNDNDGAVYVEITRTA